MRQVALVISAFGVGICAAASPSVAEESTHDVYVLDVTLVLEAPFSSASIHITKDGRMEYEGRSPKTGIEHQADSGTVSSAQFDRLARLIVNHRELMNAHYLDPALMDDSVYTLTVTVQAIPPSLRQSPVVIPLQTFETSCQRSACPEPITEIITTIKALWGKPILEVGV